ncbi:MAG: hypothetical protein ACRDT6_21415 [Micromonosporaceae bacterium]
MRLTVTVDLDPVEQVAGQPASATVTLRPTGGVVDLLNAACVEAANPHLPTEWGDCAAAIVAARVLAAGLRVGVPVVIGESTVRAVPFRLRSLGV